MGIEIIHSYFDEEIRYNKILIEKLEIREVSIGVIGTIHPK